MDISKIPVWELTILGAAGVAALLVIILWYFLGYDLAVIESANPTMEAASLMAVLI